MKTGYEGYILGDVGVWAVILLVATPFIGALMSSGFLDGKTLAALVCVPIVGHLLTAE